MNQKVFLAVCVITAIAPYIKLESTESVDALNKNITQLNISSKIQPETTSEIPGKKITCHQIEMLSNQLVIFPMGTIRIRLASKKIRDVIKNIENKKQIHSQNKQAEKVFVHEQLALIIKPVQEFFDVIQDPNILNMIKPIIMDALDHPKKSYILDFCNSKKSIVTFCEEEITSFKTLESMSKELLQFFASINLSLSDKAKDAAKKLEDHLKQIQAEKKKTEKK